MTQSPLPSSCPSCNSPILPLKGRTPNTVCLVCGAKLLKSDIKSAPFPKQIGSYTLLRRIGVGGMGEVFLAYDPICKREVALKRIRTDLTSHEVIKNRFLREARITSQLAHPAIVPIYSIHEDVSGLYYIMPFLEGKTLKELLLEAIKQEKIPGQPSMPSKEGSIVTLLRIFMSVCQAVAYAHSKGFLHRDLKPDNVMIGPYGQVFIVDWGLVHPIHGKEERSLDEEEVHNVTLTNPGKIVGTLPYMAPERALGNPPSVLTDLYALGVILYQILTLHLPFHRKSLTEFRQNYKKERFIDPSRIAPYRDVPPELCRIVEKALAFSTTQRYQSIDEMIADLENYLSGTSEWILKSSLHMNNKLDWEFQENILLPEYMAITRGLEVTEWVSLMISKASFFGNTKISFTLTVNETGKGIGILLNMPEVLSPLQATDGYCVWLSSEVNEPTKLIRSSVEIMSLPDVTLRKHKSYPISIEKIDHHIRLYFNHTLKLSYASYLPLEGTKIGILSRDADFDISPLSVSMKSFNLTLSCLAVPNAFLAHRYYTQALNEYRRIAQTFPGRAEGREALFRAGITLLEQGRNKSDPKEAEQIFSLALEEFGKLHETPGVPLEYLGKALVYEAMKDNEEEVKCFELAYRRYKKNPLMPILQEQILFRMHECSQKERIAAYRFIFLAARLLPQPSQNQESHKIFRRLRHHWEKLPFIQEEPLAKFSSKESNQQFSIQLAFWLATPLALQEILEQLNERENTPLSLYEDLLFSLLELGATQLVKKELRSFPQILHLQISFLTSSNQELFEGILKASSHCDSNILFYLIEQAFYRHQLDQVHHIADRIQSSLSKEMQQRVDCYRISAYLLQQQWSLAGELLHHYSLPTLIQENSLLHFLYGCWLYTIEGKEIAFAHFSSLLPTPFPRSWTLGTHYLLNQEKWFDLWLTRSFLWERRQLYHQLTIFYCCAGDNTLMSYFQSLFEKEFVDVVG